MTPLRARAERILELVKNSHGSLSVFCLQDNIEQELSATVAEANRDYAECINGHKNPQWTCVPCNFESWKQAKAESFNEGLERAASIVDPHVEIHGDEVMHFSDPQSRMTAERIRALKAGK